MLCNFTRPNFDKKLGRFILCAYFLVTFDPFYSECHFSRLPGQKQKLNRAWNRITNSKFSLAKPPKHTVGIIQWVLPIYIKVAGFYFWADFDHFWSVLRFWGNWGISENWLEPTIVKFSWPKSVKHSAVHRLESPWSKMSKYDYRLSIHWK